MNFAILTLAIGKEYRRTVRKGLASKRYYARRHGIPFILGGDEFHDPARPASWSKIPFARHYLERFDCIFLSDADVVFMNPDASLHRLMADHMGGRDVMLTADFNGLQFGNVFFRRSPFTFELLDRIAGETRFLDHPWWEQRAFIELYNTDANVRKRTIVVDQRLFNSYPRFVQGDDPRYCYRPGDFLVHVSSLAPPRTRVRMAEYFQILKRNLAESRQAPATPAPSELCPTLP